MKLIDFYKLMMPLFAPEGETGGISNPFETEDDKTDDDTTEDDNADDKEEDDKVDDDDDKEEDDDTEEDDKEDEDDDKDDKKDDKDDKDDKEDEEEDDEDKDQVRLTEVTDIKKAYPDFFKKFPDVRAALYRDHRYNEVIGTPEEAEDAVEKARVLDELDKDIVQNGNVEPFLTTISKQNPKAMPDIVKGVLDYVSANDKDLYLEMAAVPIKQLLRAAWKEGGKDTDLGRAAAHIHKYFFNNLDIDSKTKLEGAKAENGGKTKRELELEEKLEKIEKGTIGNFESAVSNSYVAKMTNSVREGLDKDARLTEYAKSKILEDVLVDIKNQLDKDTRYQAQMRSLWKQAKTAGLTNDFKSRIVNAALARAKSLIPATRQRIVSEALKTKKVTTPKDKDKEDKPEREPRRERSERKDEVKKPKSDLDILRS